MSLEEMKTAAVTIPVEDRIHLAAFLLHLNRRDTSEHRLALSAADRRIDAGDYVTLDQLRQMCAALDDEQP